MSDLLPLPFAFYKVCPKCKNSVGDACIVYRREMPSLYGGPVMDWLDKTCKTCGFGWSERCADAHEMTEGSGPTLARRA